MPKQRKKLNGPNPEVRIYQNFQDRNPSEALGVNELFHVTIDYAGDFDADFKAHTVDPNNITVYTKLKDNPKRRIKGHMPEPVLAYIDGRFEPGVRLPAEANFIPVKEATQMTKNIRYATKTARSIKEQVLNLLKMKDVPANNRRTKNTAANTGTTTATAGAAPEDTEADAGTAN